MPITQGEQLSIPVRIKGADGEYTSPANCNGIRISVGGVVKKWPDGEITSYDESESAWMYPMTQAESLALQDYYKVQAQVLYTGTPSSIRATNTRKVRIMKSELMDIWYV